MPRMRPKAKNRRAAFPLWAELDGVTKFILMFSHRDEDWIRERLLAVDGWDLDEMREHFAAEIAEERGEA